MIGVYSPTYQARVLKIDSDLNCITSWDIVNDLESSANAIFYLEGFWYIGETSTPTGFNKSRGRKSVGGR